MTSTTDAFQMVQQPVVALPPAPRSAPASSLRKWGNRYALWSAIHSINALSAVVTLIVAIDEGPQNLVATPLVALFFYIFGLPIALIVALVASNILVTVLPGQRASMRPIFAGVALVLGWVPVGSYVIAGEAPVSLGLLALVANLAAVWRVWEKVGPAPMAGSR